jgi:D-hydroxyproline dehydrogenase subunit beta
VVNNPYDLAVVGAGIIGLAHALAAVKRGLRVVVIDRDAQPNGASVRNFGLVVVSGQEPGIARSRAATSRKIWLEVAQAAGIAVEHRGMLVAAQRPEAMALAEAFAQTPSGAGCQILSRADLLARQPELDPKAVLGGLFSPEEIRVESRLALPKIVAWLRRQGVAFRFSTAVTAVAPPLVETSAGPIQARKVVVCPGDDLTGLLADRIAARDVTRCKLQMLRLADPGFRLAGALVSDLSLLRYDGYAQLPEAAALRARLAREQPEMLDNGVHLIVVQSADGSLVLGDSHHYGATPDPFGSERVDALILSEFARLFGQRPVIVAERWTGSYSSAQTAAFIDRPGPDLALAMVTSGTGASTGFAIGEETIAALFD